MLEWDKLLSSVRRKDLAPKNEEELDTNKDQDHKHKETRTEIERDYDRVLFSTPVRRLADKTQVFPLDPNDSVRTRLTHSHEVSNLARSMGVTLVHYTDIFKGVKDADRNVPSMLAAVGLSHDIGNPPFGHQGETAIGDWFKKNRKKVFPEDAQLPEQMMQDYFKFEGNAQALRILTKLQVINDQWGLNLTCGSLAALMKYPTYSHKTDKDVISLKKFGCFYSEMEACDEIWEQTGLNEGTRHPLAYLMEAADDIAYSVLDAEDAIKKGLVSYSDLISFLSKSSENTVVKKVLASAKKQHEKHQNHKLSPSELNDISMQMFRVYAIGALVEAITDAFENHRDDILNGKLEKDLMAMSDGYVLCEQLKDFSFKHAYKHKSVLELELLGHNTIHSIMDMLWPAIVSRGDPITVKKHKAGPFDAYAYGRISENYRRVFESKDNNLPLKYKRAQLLADMISGMTDNFALNFEQELRQLKPSEKDD